MTLISQVFVALFVQPVVSERPQRVRGAGFGPGLCAPFSNFHFGVPQTGSTVDRDRFVERPSGATSA
jgi:hypothetical protein